MTETVNHSSKQVPAAPMPSGVGARNGVIKNNRPAANTNRRLRREPHGG